MTPIFDPFGNDLTTYTGVRAPDKPEPADSTKRYITSKPSPTPTPAPITPVVAPLNPKSVLNFTKASGPNSPEYIKLLKDIGSSQLASDVLGYYGMGSYGNRGEDILAAKEALDFERKAREKIAEEDRIYNKTYQDVMLASEIEKTKSGAIPTGSYAQRVIAGETGAGQGKEGKFKNIYEAGSMLPASWMRKSFDDAEKAASKLSGVQDIWKPVTGKYDKLGWQYKDKPANITYEFVRSGVNKSPLYTTSGLGKYKTVKINELNLDKKPQLPVKNINLPTR
jgi:hypothetical protein